MCFITICSLCSVPGSRASLGDPSENRDYVPCYGLNMICPHQKSYWVLIPNIMLLRGGETFRRHLELESRALRSGLLFFSQERAIVEIQPPFLFLTCPSLCFHQEQLRRCRQHALALLEPWAKINLFPLQTIHSRVFCYSSRKWGKTWSHSSGSFRK